VTPICEPWENKHVFIGSRVCQCGTTIDNIDQDPPDDDEEFPEDETLPCLNS